MPDYCNPRPVRRRARAAPLRIGLAPLLLLILLPLTATHAEPFRHHPGQDPLVGINIWSVHAQPLGIAAWEREIESIARMGFGGVTILPQAFVNLRTGEVTEHDPTPNARFGTITAEELSAAIRRGKRLGLVVTVSPTLEAADRAIFRGHIAFNDPRPDEPPGAAKPDNGVDSAENEARFWHSYGRYLARIARIAQEAGADRLNIGAELAALDADPRNADRWAALIDTADRHFSRSIGYSTVHWNVDNQTTCSNIYANPKIDYISCSAYFGLATAEQSARSGGPGDEAFIAVVAANFSRALQRRVFPVADRLGKPVILNEVGLVPHDGAAVNPWDWTVGDRAPYDPAEARNAFEGVFRALAGRRQKIIAVNLWVWGWAGGFPGERFYIRDNPADLPHSPFDETQMRMSVEWIKAYLRQ